MSYESTLAYIIQAGDEVCKDAGWPLMSERLDAAAGLQAKLDAVKAARDKIKAGDVAEDAGVSDLDAALG